MSSIESGPMLVASGLAVSLDCGFPRVVSATPLPLRDCDGVRDEGTASKARLSSQAAPKDSPVARSSIRSPREITTHVPNQGSIPVLRVSSHAILALCCVGTLTAETHTTNAPRRLTVSAAYSLQGGMPAIEFELRNSSPESLSLDETQLPWNRKSGIVLVVVNARSGEPLRRSVGFRDYFGRPPVVSIGPGESLKGTARLSGFFGRSESTYTEQDLVVFWYYSPHAEDGTELGSYGGWFEFKFQRP